MSDPRIAAATITLTGIDPIHGKDVIPDERDVKWLLVELDEADKAAGIIRIDPSDAIDIIAQQYDFYEWDLAHKILQDERDNEKYRVGWATLTLSKARLRARKLLDALQKSEQ